MDQPPSIPYAHESLRPDRMLRRADAFRRRMARRRSIRQFSSEPVPRRLIELAIETASTSPSGAHQQPWTFVAISEPGKKRQIREAAEREEYASYEGGRMPEAWRQALRPLGTSWRKPYLETVPWIVVVFEQTYGLSETGQRIKHYYVKESVGMACGLFLAAVHQMGLATLTHTPSPMGFLSELLQRPVNERPYVLFPVGYPAAEARVPDIHRKPLGRVAVWYE